MNILGCLNDDLTNFRVIKGKNEDKLRNGVQVIICQNQFHSDQ